MRFVILVTLLLASGAGQAESLCYGTTAQGRLERGVKLPPEGNNFVSYGVVPALAGRTYVHSKVRDVIVEAYLELEQDLPGKVYKYAETGFKAGGRFKPHKTHQNGLSVDFMVPVVDSDGVSVHLPTHPFNRYGYDIEFDNKGRYKNYSIDYDALAAHMVALHKVAQRNGIDVWRMIFDPTLAPNLYTTKYGTYIKQNIEIPTKASWVRHDEHYHVDFEMKCRPLAP